MLGAKFNLIECNLVKNLKKEKVWVEWKKNCTKPYRILTSNTH